MADVGAQLLAAGTQIELCCLVLHVQQLGNLRHGTLLQHAEAHDAGRLDRHAPDATLQQFHHLTG